MKLVKLCFNRGGAWCELTLVLWFMKQNTQGKVITLKEQISNFEKLMSPQIESESQLTSQRAEIMDNYLFLVAAGTNDYQFNYFKLPVEIAPSPQAFATKLVSIYSHQLKVLYPELVSAYIYATS